MATSGQLIEALSKAIGVPAKTVFLHDRVLSEAGVRSKGGRGRSAASMTPTDAANLLLAVLSSPVSGPSVVTSLKQWESYSKLAAGAGSLTIENPREYIDFDDGAWRHPSLKLLNLTRLPAKHSLTDAVAALIGSFLEGILPLGSHHKTKASYPEIQLKLSAPRPVGEILVGTENGYEVHYYYDPGLITHRIGNDPRPLTFVSLVTKGWGPRPHDLGQQRWVTTHTIVRLAEALRGERLVQETNEGSL